MNKIQAFYDRVFGNNDGKFNWKDLPSKSVLIVGLAVDLLVLIAEYRVYSVGLKLTDNSLLAFGFVAVSSLPFFLGQLAFRYNRANTAQQVISVAFVVMGLLTSAYYGFADYILSTKTVISVANGVSVPMDLNSLYLVAVSGTIAIIVGGLLYVFFDDEFANTLKANRIEGKVRVAEHEQTLKRRLLTTLRDTRLQEQNLANEFPDDYDSLAEQFQGHANKNPTHGNGTNR